MFDLKDQVRCTYILKEIDQPAMPLTWRFMRAHREEFDVLRPEEFASRLPDLVEMVTACRLPGGDVWAIHGNDDDANRKVRWIDPFFPESGEVLRRLPLGSAPPITLAIPEPLVQTGE